jgi:hypothetical protein
LEEKSFNHKVGAQKKVLKGCRSVNVGRREKWYTINGKKERGLKENAMVSKEILFNLTTTFGKPMGKESYNGMHSRQLK